MAVDANRPHHEIVERLHGGAAQLAVNLLFPNILPFPPFSLYSSASYHATCDIVGDNYPKTTERVNSS